MLEKILRNVHGVLIFFAISETLRYHSVADYVLLVLVIIYEILYLSIIIRS